MSYTKFHDVEQLQIAGEILKKLIERFHPQCHILFLLFTYEPGSVSFVATYPDRAKSIETIQHRLKRWETNAPPGVYDEEVHGWLPQAEHLQEWHTFLERQIERKAPGCGYALFAGQGAHTQYQSNAARDGMKQVMRELIDDVKREMV